MDGCRAAWIAIIPLAIVSAVPMAAQPGPVAEGLWAAERHLSPAVAGEGGGPYLRPRDLLKFGQLYLDGGVWNGRRVVGEAWVRASTSLHPEIHPSHTDGYSWHLNEIRAGGRTWRQYEANGNGGQLVMVLPELDLVVSFTASSYNQYGTWRKLRDEFLARYVIPSIEGVR